MPHDEPVRAAHPTAPYYDDVVFAVAEKFELMFGNHAVFYAGEIASTFEGLQLQGAYVFWLNVVRAIEAGSDTGRMQ